MSVHLWAQYGSAVNTPCFLRDKQGLPWPNPLVNSDSFTKGWNTTLGILALYHSVSQGLNLRAGGPETGRRV